MTVVNVTQIGAGQRATLTVDTEPDGGATLTLDITEVPQPAPEPHVPTVLGWSPPSSTDPAALTDMLNRYRADLIRLYTSDGNGIASWSLPPLSLVPAGCRVWYSFKDWDPATSPAKIRQFMTDAPVADGPHLVTLDHEPDNRGSGDPTPAEFDRQCRELLAAVADHPRRSEFWFGPIFTEYAATKNPEIAPTWYQDYGRVIELPGWDFVATDVYDTGYSDYRTPEQRAAFTLDLARSVGLPACFGEWGIARKPSVDSNGTRAAQAMRDFMTYLRAQPDVPVVSWFYRGECVLHAPVTSAGVTFTRDPERAAFVDLMASNPA